MSQNNAPILYVGLDVAKSSLQLDLAGTPHSLTNDAKGHAQLRKLLNAHPGPTSSAKPPAAMKNPSSASSTVRNPP